MKSIESIVQALRVYHPEVDAELLQRVYRFSAEKHAGQLRKSGLPYITHPLNVAFLLTELNLDLPSVCAALLHDVLEDTPTTREELQEAFGEEITRLVEGLTKLSHVRYQSKATHQAHNLHKMLVAMAQDIRVMLIKLCDRLDNMQTLEFQPLEAQERIARETLDIYAPLAHRLGLQTLCNTLEEESFRHLEPEQYRDLQLAMGREKHARERYIAEVCALLQEQLKAQGLGAEVHGRAKPLYSIWKKMKSHQIPFEEVHDAIAFRVLVEEVRDCYAALGILHSHWTPIPGRFKDYMAVPKSNGYQSLHTTLIDSVYAKIEVQIRTHAMHRAAETGIAAHWKYKERGSKPYADPVDERFRWLRNLLECHQEAQHPAAFLEGIQGDLFQDEIYTLTPKGELHMFPRGATTIDFAYAIHSEVGHHMTGAKVNGRIVPISYPLRNGDVVEIMTSSTQHPSRDWLLHARTHRARARIQHALQAVYRAQSHELGRELLTRSLRQRHSSLSKLIQTEHDKKELAAAFQCRTLEELFLRIGYGSLAAEKIALHLLPYAGGEAPASPASQEIRSAEQKKLEGTFCLNGMNGIMARYAKCCNPLPGEGAIGFVTQGRGLTVHRHSCINLLVTDPARRVVIEWDEAAQGMQRVRLQIRGRDECGTIANLAHVCKVLGINIYEWSSSPEKTGWAMHVITCACSTWKQLNLLMRDLGRLEGIQQVERIPLDKSR